MTGIEFRAIRMFNGISQKEIAMKLGFSCRDTIKKYEKKDFLPQRFVQVISDMVGYDFTNPTKLRDYVDKLPEEVFHLYKAVKRSIFFM